MNIPYQIIRSARRKRSIALNITPEGQVIVKAPLHTSQRLIEQFVQQHQDWIQDRLKDHQHKSKVKKQFNNGELFPFQGQLYPLSITQNHGRTRIKVNLIDDMFVIITPPNLSEATRQSQLRLAMKRWYINQSRPILEEQSAYYSQRINKPFQTIRIKETSSRWGSCSSNGNLNFNWKLVLAPSEILTYVVIHEVCHLVHQHHRASFWDLVRQHDPNYPQHRRWLHRNGWKLEI